jgi:hypothetical protein
MDYGNSIFPGLISENSKLASFPVICVIIVLDANFKIYQGNLSRFKIAQAITQYCYYILDFIFMEERSIWAKPFEGSHTKLRASQNSSREDFLENRAFQSALYFEKKLVKNSIYHFVVTRAESCCFGFNKNICSLYWWFSVSFIDKLSISSSYFIICDNFISVEF